ncbi:two-component response regulator ORR23-like [Coffea eugenioides]|uniref:two-component response regulator ORR23-like n=1 Tax=Coffea eugenioides TaxID=49369 RepID=UPI000F61257E|nr:two-component response regulator ORR23-like [Coffea eugenioides]
MVHVTLVKLVRIKEFRNIWQHVIRKKKFDTKKQGKSTYEDKAVQGNKDVCNGHQNIGNRDQNGKLNKKRKDEEDESEDDGHDHEDPATQIQPNFVILLLVDNMTIRKRIHVRVEHVQPSRCNEEIKHRTEKIMN